MASLINIAQRLRPFSHTPKTTCLIPGTDTLVEACPACIHVKDFSGNILKEITLDIEGPLQRFTVMQDLERGCVTVFSECYRLHILPSGEVKHAKNPGLPPLEQRERLALGSHKKQEWEAIRKRGDFREIFPIWFRLGSLLSLPPQKVPSDEGMFTLLNACKEAITAHKPECILPAFHKVFLAGFGHLFVPRLIDEECQGILPSDTPVANCSPLYLLTEGSALIRSLFLAHVENEMAILPNLPPEFAAGRMVNLDCPPYGMVDLEWSKKTIRRFLFKAKKDGEIYLHFRSPLRGYRVRRSVREKGTIHAIGEPLAIKSGSLYLLDQFHK